MLCSKIKAKKYQGNNVLDYWLYGKHSVLAALRNERRLWKNLLITKEAFTDLVKRGISFSTISYELKSYKVIDSIFDNRVIHQGIALFTSVLEQPSLYSILKDGGNIVLLDQVQDPQNVGNIIRLAAAFKCAAVVTTIDRGISESASLLKAASGYFESVPLLQVKNLSQTIASMKEMGYWIVGTSVDGNSEDIDKMSNKKLGIVFGSEGSGLRKLIIKNCDFLYNINTSIDSINVSSAAAIVLHMISNYS